jgi:small subunit ribosomal protein S20
MPHTKSAKKHLRQSEKRRERNRAAKKAIKSQIKKTLELAKTGTAEQLKEAYNLAAKKLDKAAARHIVHRNLAARKKSQLGLLLRNKVQGAAKS